MKGPRIYVRFLFMYEPAAEERADYSAAMVRTRIAPRLLGSEGGKLQG
jgi:hypothetical protein